MMVAVALVLFVGVTAHRGPAPRDLGGGKGRTRLPQRARDLLEAEAHRLLKPAENRLVALVTGFLLIAVARLVPIVAVAAIDPTIIAVAAIVGASRAGIRHRAHG